jgi:hypothetical protein
MDNTNYIFHQTPKDCARDLITYVPLEVGDIVLEPFKGEGAFYDCFPSYVIKLWAEKEKGIDYRDISNNYDWVITNPPFRLETDGKRVNAFWFILDYYSTRAKKGIAFLGNDACFGTLTPRRMKILEERGWGITKVVISSIKKWRGRYFFIILEKKEGFIKYLSNNY